LKPDRVLFINTCISVAVACLTLYANIRKNNELTALQLAIPRLEKEVKQQKKENERLQYEIDRFENPLHLMELLRRPEFSHLHYPYIHEVIIIDEKRSKI